VDDLSQEIAAQAAGVELVLNEEWLAKMEGFFTRRGRTMPPQPQAGNAASTAEVLDNRRHRLRLRPRHRQDAIFLHARRAARAAPHARGAGHSRLLARSGAPVSIHLKRFHSYGLGESHVDSLLAGVETLDYRQVA